MYFKRTIFQPIVLLFCFSFLVVAAKGQIWSELAKSIPAPYDLTAYDEFGVGAAIEGNLMSGLSSLKTLVRKRISNFSFRERIDHWQF